MSNIKPIETVYNGYRFRSRLEARWAVFFDAVSIKYEYELEGFELGDGVRYLPDFWLPEFNFHVEVKPHHELTPDDIRKLVLFAADGDHPILLIAGTPGSESMYFLSRRVLEAWSYFSSDYGENDELLRALFWEAVSDWSSVCFGYLPQELGLKLLFRQLPPQGESMLMQGIVAAKQARFEFGKKGA